jgi:phage tail tape-measure protein
MRNRVFTLAIIVGMAAGSSSIAFAQDPVSAAIGTAGAIAGSAIGAAGAIAGSAVGAATGTAAAVVGAYPYGYYGRPCPRGYRFYSGACYLR